MKQPERDELLVRIDERLKSLNREVTENVKDDIKKIKEYNRLQNDHTAKIMKECAKNTAWRKAIIWIIGGIISTLILFITNIKGLW